MTGQLLWTRWRGGAVALAAANGIGGAQLRSGREQRGEGRELRGGEKCRRSRGVCGSAREGQGGAASRRWSSMAVRAAATRLSSFWGEVGGDWHCAVG